MDNEYYDDLLKTAHIQKDLNIVNEDSNLYFDEDEYRESLKDIHKERNLKMVNHNDDYTFDEDSYTRNIMESNQENNPNDTKTPDQLDDPAVRVWGPGDGSRLMFPNNADPNNPPIPEGAPVEDNEKYENQSGGNALKPNDLIDIDIMIDRLKKQMEAFKDDVQGKEYTQMLRWLNELKKSREILSKVKKHNIPTNNGGKNE